MFPAGPGLRGGMGFDGREVENEQSAQREGDAVEAT
jgi:hypothetical protein